MIARGEPLPAFDLHCPLLSLPLAFATELATIPASIPYLAPPQCPSCGLAQPAAASAGRSSAWSGPGIRIHDNDLNRSIGLATLAPLLDLPDVAFVSLQHDIRERDLPVLQKSPSLHRLESRFCDFADTAAAISLLDAVIAVDTAVAHLAGAHRQTAVVAAAVCRGFSLAARTARQPLVSDRAALPAAKIRRLGQRDRHATARLHAGGVFSAAQALGLTETVAASGGELPEAAACRDRRYTYATRIPGRAGIE